MRKIASILAFILGACLVFTYLSMVHQDGTNAADNISRGFAELNSGDHSALQEDLRESAQRHADERMYGFGGLVVLIAGFALWPRRTAVAPQITA